MRYPCLIAGILAALLFLILLVTCRVVGLPVSNDGANRYQSAPVQLSDSTAKSMPIWVA